jgi:hypothetical protein
VTDLRKLLISLYATLVLSMAFAALAENPPVAGCATRNIVRLGVFAAAHTDSSEASGFSLLDACQGSATFAGDSTVVAGKLIFIWYKATCRLHPDSVLYQIRGFRGPIPTSTTDTAGGRRKFNSPDTTGAMCYSTYDVAFNGDPGQLPYQATAMTIKLHNLHKSLNPNRDAIVEAWLVYWRY